MLIRLQTFIIVPMSIQVVTWTKQFLIFFVTQHNTTHTIHMQIYIALLTPNYYHHILIALFHAQIKGD